MLSGGDEGWSCHFLSDTQLIARGEGGSRTRLDVSDPRKPIVIAPPFAKNHSVNAVHRPSGLIATAYSRNGITTPGSVLSVWAVTKDGISEKWSRPAGTKSGIDGTVHLDFDDAGARLLRTTQTPGGHLVIHDVRTGEPLLKVKHDAYKAVFAGTHGHLIAISSELQEDNTNKGNIAILDSKEGRILNSLDRDSAFYALAASPERRLVTISPDGRLLATDGRDRAVRIFEFRTR